MSSGVVPVGANDVRLWGLTPLDRLRRIAAAQGLEVAADGEIRADLDYVFDPAWLKIVAARPGLCVTRGGVPVLTHGPAAETIAWEGAGARLNSELRKREQPFMERLTEADVARVERISFAGAYKGVTDALTKYLWPGWAFRLTRAAARRGVTPNMVTLVGLFFCVAATAAFWSGWLWAGLALGLVFMVLDTVDGKLARCTIASSRWGGALDHGIDLIHPLIWWYAWGVGLAAWGRPLAHDVFLAAMIALAAGYVVQRLIEGAFILAFGMHIHVWRPLDSHFRLVTARRNPNWAILLAFLALGRPDLGLIALAVWTVLSCLFHLVRLVQAGLRRGRGRAVASWLG